LTVGTVWHSPKTRAVETTRIFLEASGNSDAVCEETQGLKPEADVEGMLRDLEDFKGTSLLLVTHLPFVAELAHALLDGQANGDHAFPTAGMTAFERKAGKWKKLWSLDPSTLK
jgi:phosphohistidine phosphatase SixA